MKFDIALLASNTGQLSVSSTDDTEANEAGFNTSKLLLQVCLPHSDAIEHTLVLVAQEDGNGQQPLAQSVLFYAHLHNSNTPAHNLLSLSNDAIRHANIISLTVGAVGGR